MKIKYLKLLVIALFALPLTAAAVFSGSATNAGTVVFDEPADTYKAKCAMCHGPAAAKYYDPEKPEAEQVEIILKGKKGEKPPYMPGYEEKGMTAEQAQALAAYMKKLRTAE